MMPGKIVKINKKDKFVTVEMDHDKHFTSLHISCCKNFKPKIGDLVNVSDTSDEEWIIVKEMKGKTYARTMSTL